MASVIVMTNVCSTFSIKIFILSKEKLWKTIFYGNMCLSTCRPQNNKKSETVVVDFSTSNLDFPATKLVSFVGFFNDTVTH